MSLDSLGRLFPRQQVSSTKLLFSVCGSQKMLTVFVHLFFQRTSEHLAQVCFLTTTIMSQPLTYHAVLKHIPTQSRNGRLLMMSKWETLGSSHFFYEISYWRERSLHSNGLAVHRSLIPVMYCKAPSTSMLHRGERNWCLWRTSVVQGIHIPQDHPRLHDSRRRFRKPQRNGR